ncbi:MAG TPA: nickel-responsive transcriptional regulator NikR [Xanthobacteraceae bacterium]|nr:nickel-responsive transcriptional regulator NikR [Xanthobacteraceae bacterium]
MERVTISVSEEFAAELAAFMRRNGYENRSEAVRDLARLGLNQARNEEALGSDCVATFSYVFGHDTRELAKRLTNTHHAHHDFQIATLHVHLDHDSCLEVAVLRGKVAAVKDFANSVIAERGVTYGTVSLIPVAVDTAAHAHGSGAHRHAHAHPKN